MADWGRVDFLRGHLRAIHEAIEASVDVRGSLVWWGLRDSFGWAMRYGPRLGIFRVDDNPLERALKQSGLWYSDVVARNAINM